MEGAPPGLECRETTPGQPVPRLYRPAVATFCGELFSDDRLIMRAAGVARWSPPLVIMDLDSSLAVRCFVWFSTLPAGTHKVRVQWKTQDPGYAEVY